MDRTAWIVVSLCVVGLFFYFKKSSEDARKYQEEMRKQAEQEQVESGDGKSKDGDTKGEPGESTAPDGKTPEVADAPPAEAKSVVLENEKVRYTLTNHGAGIATAELLAYPLKLDNGGEVVTLNEQSEHPIGALSRAPKEFDETIWEIVSQSPEEVVFASDSFSDLRVEKRFQLPGPEEEPHLLKLAITLKNQDAEKKLDRLFLYAGSLKPLHPGEWTRQVGLFWMEAGGDLENESVDYFKAGFFGGEAKAYDEFSAPAMSWAGVNDQFFTTLIKPESPYDSTIWGSRIPAHYPGVEKDDPKGKTSAVEAAIGLPGLTLGPAEQRTLRYEMYIGPKEYRRLSELGDDRTAVMLYDDVPLFGWIFGWAIRPLASWLIQGLVALQGWVGSFGIAIILITIIIRTIIWPVYAKSTRTMKRMSKLNPKMKEIREKYKDNQQKQSEEMMKLYREYGVNPLGGCLPMFIQLPVFLAFYGMLWRAVELRHESFLWVDDLSMPDTLFTIAGFPINLLPIVMAITTFIQMQMTPKTGDKTQRMIFMLMPVFFLVICYNFASALALYWTTQNIFSIGQTWLMNKLPEPELKKKKGSGKKGFMARLQEQAAAAQKAKQQGGGGQPTGGPGSRTRLASEKGDRHTKSKKRKKR